MKSKYLFPIVFRKIGWSLFIPFLLWGIGYMFSGGTFIEIDGSNTIALFDGFSDTKFLCITNNDSWTDELIIIFLTISMLFIGFSKEKDEDEMTPVERQNAFVWSFWVTALLYTFGIITIYGISFLSYSFVMPYIFFILYITKFNIAMHKLRRNLK